MLFREGNVSFDRGKEMVHAEYVSGNIYLSLSLADTNRPFLLPLPHS